MCLIGIKLRHDAGGQARLIIAANRDEAHDRPTARAHWWTPSRYLFAGQDLRAGGTWLGVTRSGRFAALTNVRSPPAMEALNTLNTLNTLGATPAKRSRGELPAQFLNETVTAQLFCEQLMNRGAAYGGFNLLAFDGNELWWCANQGLPARRVEPGIHSLSNASLDTPWPKAGLISRAMQHSENPDTLLTTLGRRDIPTGNLPDTGVGPELERRLAPTFILGPDYGTRSSSVMSLDSTSIQVVEVSFDSSGKPVDRVTERFSVRESERHH